MSTRRIVLTELNLTTLSMNRTPEVFPNSLLIIIRVLMEVSEDNADIELVPFDFSANPRPSIA